jgi:membrane fusion protein, multidrug efflux system
MRFGRALFNLAVLACALAIFAAYKPDTVAAYSPTLGVWAKQANALLPAWAGGGPAAVAQAPQAPPKPAISVVVGTVARKDLPYTIQAIGTTQTVASVALRAHFDAEVREVLVADGAQVKAGDVMFRLDDRQLRALLDGAQAQLAKDTTMLEQAQRDVDRYTDLVSRNATPQLNLDNAKTAVASAKAAMAADRAAIDNLNVQIGWSTIVAPISGRVGVVSIKAGNIVKAGDNGPTGVLATINQVSPIYVSFSLPQTLLPAVREAMAEVAKVLAKPQGAKTSVEGKLSLIDNTVDPTTGSIVARAIFDNADEALWPGQLCNVTVELKIEPDQVVVPRVAIQNGQTGFYVFTIKDNLAHVQPVEVGRIQGEEIVVTKGLSGGETVVVDGALLLTEGAKVAPRDPAKGGA